MVDFSRDRSAYMVMIDLRDGTEILVEVRGAEAERIRDAWRDSSRIEVAEIDGSIVGLDMRFAMHFHITSAAPTSGGDGEDGFDLTESRG